MIRAGARRALRTAASTLRPRGGATAASAPRLVPLPPQFSAAAAAQRAWGPLRCTAAASRRFATDAAEPSAASSAASSAAGEETFEFRSETRRVLDIVTNSLYTERDIFLRELVSNSCDALEKARLQAMSAGAQPGPLDIRISTAAGTLTIEDSGCGMSREELIANLGTIARSGTAEFVAKAGAVDGASLIGRFGVGFYAAFMVASRAEVFTRAAGGEPLVWRSDGGGAFTIARASEAEAPARGTKVVLHLKDDVAASGAYSSAEGVEAILKRHSAFVPHPVFLDGARVNTLPAVWALRPAEVTDEQHQDFFRHLAGAGAPPPAFRMHFATDSPLALNALLYFPARNDELSLSGGMERLPPGVSLYCRKVLIMRDAPGLLPQYLRFLKGVVDCEDLPLNISRETLQDSAIVRRLRELLTARALKFLADSAKKDPAGFERWHAAMNGFVKEGLCSDADEKRKEALAKLLRYESSALPRGELTALEPALARATERLDAAGDAPDAKKPRKIYYLVAQSRDAAESSPYLEAFKARNIEVLLLFTPAVRTPALISCAMQSLS
jgi:HSP90 family molecular chaperone